MIFETYSLGVSMAFPYQHTTQRGALLQHTDLPKSLLKHPGRILRTLEALCNLQSANLKNLAIKNLSSILPAILKTVATQKEAGMPSEKVS